MKLNKILNKNVAFDIMMTQLSKKNYSIESEKFKNLGYIFDNGQVIIYAHRDGVLSVKLDSIMDFCKELLLIADEYNDNVCKRLGMDVRTFSAGGGKSRYE